MTGALVFDSGALAQQNLPVTDTPSAVAAVNTANGDTGDTIQLANSITLTQGLPAVSAPVSFDPNGFSLTGFSGQTLFNVSGASINLLTNGSFVTPANGALFANDAVVRTTASGVTVTNAATLSSGGGRDGAIVMEEDGTVTNSGSVTGVRGIEGASFATITNTGSITGTGAGGIFIAGSDTTMSTVTNSGSISGAYSTAYDVGSSLNGYGLSFGAIGTLNNTGSISSTATAAVALDADANTTGLSVVNNNAGGTISGSQVGVYLLGQTATVNNAAGAAITGGTGNAIYAVNNAVITNGGTLSSGVGSGYDAVYVTGSGSLTNSGAITGDGAAVQFNGSGNVTNSQGGTITGGSGSAIYIEGAGTLTNDGILVSTASSGATFLGGGSITNTGTITGAIYGGVQLGSSSHPNGGTLTNSGTIQSTVDGSNAAALIGDSSVVTNSSTGVIASTLTAGSGSWGLDFEGNNQTLTNAGVIRGDTAVVFDGSGALTNTGTISGATTGVTSGAGGTSGAVNITSSGTINGGTYAIQLTGAHDNTISLLAGSTTTGLISTDSGNDSVTLAGASTGGVNLGAGNNTLTLVTGASAGGTLDGGAGGTNALILSGAATGTLTAAQLADFATVTKTGSGTWFVNGPSTLAAPWTLQQGTVQITDVTGVGTAPVVDNAILSLYGASGVFTNAVSGAGAVYVTDVGAGNTLTFSGNLTNTGASNIASMLVFDASHVAISGANTSGSIGVALQGDGGTLDVLAGASITSAGYAVYGGGANVTVNNAGTLVGHAQNGAYGTGVDLYAGGTLNNSGSITGDDTGVELGQTGTVNNAAGATITGLAGNAIYAVVGANIVNSGTLTSGAGTGYDAIFVTTNGSLTNSGAITGDGAAVQFNGAANITNAAGGTITGGSGSAIYIRGTSDLSNDGTLISTGSESVAILQGGTITNNGTITGTFGGAQLGSSSHPNGGTLTNSGTIQATMDGGNGATLIGDNSVVANNAGGVIAATHTAGSGSWGLDLEGNNQSLTNAGAIRGDVAVVFDGSGTLTNAATGVISGATTGVASGPGGTSGAVNITSSGTINGGTYAIQLTGAYDNTISLLAGSTTTGLISTDSGNDSVTLAGASTGGVNLGAGNNTLTLVTGASAGGTLDGGAGGTNALILSGAATGTLTAAQLADFATVTKTGSGTWFVNGPSTLAAPWTLQQGTVQITDVTGVGTAPVVDNAILSLYGASGVFTNAVSGAGAVYVTDVGAGNTLTFSGNLTNTGASNIASMLVFDASHVAISGANTSGSIGVALQGDGGTLDVLAGASITSAGYAVYGGGANVTVNNAGTLVGHAQNGAYGTGVDLYAGGTLNNSGSITGDDTGVELGQTGTVNNAAGATITGLAGNAIYAVVGANIVNSGTLTSGAGTGYDAIFVTTNGSLTNSGAITGDGAAVQFNGAANITNAAGGTITGGSGSAIYIRGTSDLSNDGTLISTGSESVAILQGGTITNNGTITGTFGGAQLGSSSHPNGGTLTNSGTIQATMDGGNGATLIGDNSVVANNAGGVIAATHTAGSGSWGLDLEGNNQSLTNAGAIRGDVAVVFDGSGTLTNAATGVISGATTGVASGAGGTSGAVNITSSGTINGGTYAIQLTGAHDNTISLLAGSTTTGLISTDSGNDFVTLAGASTGGVNLGAGNNTLTLVTGASAGGTLDGGAGGTNALILTGTTAGTVSAAQLADFNTVTKTGTGAWTLSGSTSTLAALVAIQQGTLSLASDAALGTGALTIGGGGELQVTATTGGARSVTIGGVGADIDVASGATYTLSGVVSGAAGTSLNLNHGGGAGTLALTANNTATLASDINLYGGTVAVGVSGALGIGTVHVYDPDIALANGVTLANNIDLRSTLTVQQAGGTGGLSGVISESVPGSGVAKTGAGVLALSGVNSYTGATMIESGTLALVGAGSIAASSTVVDNGALDISGATSGASIKSLSGAGAVSLGAQTLTLTAAADTFSGSISGTGGVTLAGGQETLTGTNTYSGATTVSGGSLVLDGSLPNSTVVVASGGSIQGSGVIANVAAAAGTTLSPGGATAIGQVTPSGNLTLAPGSVYQVTATAAGQSDLLAVGGKATVTDAVVQVQAQPGTYARNTAYTILTAAGGVAGTFAGVTSNFAFLTPSLSYTAGAVDLTLYNNSIPFQSLATTSNQVATATAVNRSNQTSALYNAVLVQTAAGAQQAFNALSGEIYATAPIELLDQSHYVRDALLGRMRQAGDSLASGGPSTSDMGPGPLHLTAWGQVIGAWANNDSRNPGIASFHADTGGGILGVDGQAQAWRVGVALAQLETNITVPDRESRDNVQSSNVALYATGPIVGALKARVGFNYAWDNMHAARTIAFPGFLESVGANYHSQTADGFGELGYALRFQSVAIEPYANLAYVHVHTGAFAEPAGVAALQGTPSNIHGVFGDTGLRFTTRYAVNEKVTLSPYLDLAWRHLYSNDQTTAALNFESTGTSFSVTGAALDPNAAKVEAGLSWDTRFGMSLTAAYVGQISRNWQDNQVKLALSWAF
jgi:uncharacterized protein with beta-barrel porin domain